MPLHFLYVEDDPLSREVMQMLVRNVRPEPRLTVFGDSADFLMRAALLEPTPALILLDVHMQPIDGFGMLRQLRAHPRLATVSVIAVTASVMNEEINQLRHAGFNGAIGKPLDFDHFPRLIERALNGHEVWHVS